MKNFLKVLLGTALAASMVSFDVNAAATPTQTPATNAKRTERPDETSTPRSSGATKVSRTNTTPAASSTSTAQQSTPLVQDLDDDIFGPDTPSSSSSSSSSSLPSTPLASPSPATAPVLAARLHEVAQTGNVAALQHINVTPETLNTPDAAGKTALHLAVQHNHETCVFILMQKGANPNTRDAEGNTPLHTAIANNSISCVNILLRTAALELVDTTGNSPLHAAVMNNHAHIVALIAKKAKPEIFTTRNYLFETPLHVAAQRGHTECLIELIESGKNALDTANLAGNTALHLAAINGHGDCVQILLKNGANPDLENLNRNTFLDEAHKAGTYRHILPFIEVLEQPEPTTQISARSGRFTCAIQ
ncbi:ankyrin repeat domain-containing protein [Candidatus Babeliales bacterium]|nr:ankyrin repeat domain-containing protein [Candidatus Babeliales bacterium]